MNQAFKKIQGVSIELSPCPFCGGNPEWVLVPGEDFVMRCSKCHASTPKARWTPEEAARDWNAHDVIDDHFAITSDTKLDSFLKAGVYKVLFSEYSNIEEYPPCDNGFLCSGAVIIAENSMLSVAPENSHLLYDEISGYGEIYNKPIAPEGIEIAFVRSRWRKRNLLSLEFKCGDTRIIVAPKADRNCMIIREEVADKQQKTDKDWRYSVVGNITKTHVDEQDVLRYGTSAFCGGTKVYLCGKNWNKWHNTIGVIGLNRFKQIAFSDVSPELIENVRCQKAYKPSVLTLMNNWEFSDCWWDKSAEDKAETKKFVEYWESEVTKK